MESIFGIVGKDFVLVAADAKAARSILVYKDDEDKMMQLDSHKLLLGAGPQSDRVEFSEYIQKNLKLYELRNGVRLDGSAAANYVRGELARYLRQGPYQVNLLVAAVDQVSEAEAQLTPEKMAGTPVPSLHWIDYLGSMVKMNYGVHGYGAHFCLSILDKEWQVNHLKKPACNCWLSLFVAGTISGGSKEDP